MKSFNECNNLPDYLLNCLLSSNFMYLFW